MRGLPQGPPLQLIRREAAIRFPLGCLLLASVLAWGGCGDEPAPTHAPWDEVETSATPPPPGAADPGPGLAAPLTDGERLARRILLLDLGADDHAVNERAAARSWGRRWGRGALPAAPHLRDHILREPLGQVRLAAITLAAIGADGLPYLGQALAAEHALSREIVLVVLREEGKAAAPLAPAVVPLLQDADDDVRVSAAFALEAFGAKEPEVRDALRAALLSALTPAGRASHLGEAACAALHALGFADAQTLDAYARVARGAARESLRAAALEAFWELSTDRKRAVELAKDLRHVASLDRRTTEMLVEGGCDEPAVIERYVDGLPWRMREEQRITAAEHLVRTGPNGRTASIELAFRVLDWAKDAGRRARAADVLAKTGPEGRANEHMREALLVHADPDHEPPAVVAACRQALAALGMD